MARHRAELAILVAIAVIGATVLYGVIAVDRPQVESVDNEWGAVTNERSEVETRIGVDNPLLLRAGDAAADVSYTVSVNDIVIASEQKDHVELAGTESSVTVSTWIDNDEIPEWWVSHVTRNETTTVRIEPDVVTEYGGVRFPADEWTYERTVRTNLLESARTNETQRFQVYDRTAFVVNETDAQWGDVTANRTPIDASATVTNPTEIPVPITEIGYTVRLNGVVVGQGVAAQPTVVEPGSTETIETTAVIDNSALDNWWVTHLRNDGTSNMTVDFNATLEYAGLQRTVPLDFLSYDHTFQTNLFGATEASGNESASDRNASRAQARLPAQRSGPPAVRP